jgi:flagellar basal body P-ring formation protein FlgA
MKLRIVTAALTFLAAFGLAPRGNGPWTPSICHALTQLTKVYVVSDVRAERKRVTLLDLCNVAGVPDDWQKLMTEIDIGESPAPGTEKVINPLQLKAFVENFIKSQEHDPSKVKIVLPDRISVRRVTTLVTREQIEGIYRDFILSKVPWEKEDIVVSAITYAGNVELPRGDMTCEVTTSTKDRFLGTVAVSIQFLVNGEKETSLNVSGKVGLSRNIVHATRALKRNSIVSEEDVEVQKISITDNPERYSRDLDQAVGRRVLREISARHPVMAADLENPAALKRGATVTIVYEKAGLTVTAKGQAREDAGIGSSIRVVNVMTNRTVACRVLDATTVQVIP